MTPVGGGIRAVGHVPGHEPVRGAAEGDAAYQVARGRDASLPAQVEVVSVVQHLDLDVFAGPGAHGKYCRSWQEVGALGVRRDRRGCIRQRGEVVVLQAVVVHDAQAAQRRSVPGYELALDGGLLLPPDIGVRVVRGLPARLEVERVRAPEHPRVRELGWRLRFDGADRPDWVDRPDGADRPDGDDRPDGYRWIGHEKPPASVLSGLWESFQDLDRDLINDVLRCFGPAPVPDRQVFGSRAPRLECHLVCGASTEDDRRLGIGADRRAGLAIIDLLERGVSARRHRRPEEARGRVPPQRHPHQVADVHLEHLPSVGPVQPQLIHSVLLTGCAVRHRGTVVGQSRLCRHAAEAPGMGARTLPCLAPIRLRSRDVRRPTCRRRSRPLRRRS